MFCHSCGNQVPDGLQFCPNCGQPLNAPGPLVSSSPVVWTPPAGAKAEPGRWISEGWQLVKADMGTHFLMAVTITVLATLVPFIIQGPLMAGFHIYIMRKMTGQNGEFADLFKGFNYFIPTLIASMIIALFTSVGFILCVIPGLVVAAMYKFTYLFIVDRRMEFWPAMQASHAVVKNDYFGFTMFLLLLALINLLGALCCIVGIFITIPISFAAITVAYKEIVGFDERTVGSL